MRRSDRIGIVTAAFIVSAVPWYAPDGWFAGGVPVWAAGSLLVTAVWSVWLSFALRRHWADRSGQTEAVECSATALDDDGSGHD